MTTHTDAITFHAELAAKEVQETEGVTLLAFLLSELRQAKHAVALVCDEAERRLVEQMTDRKVEIPGLGLVERKPKTARRQWDNDSLIQDLKPRLVVTDDGEPLDGPAVLERVQEVFRLGGGNARVTVLRRLLGVDSLDEYCVEDFLGHSIVIGGGQS